MYSRHYAIFAAMKESLPIRHLIFDLGAVLLNIDFQHTIDAFAALGIAPEDMSYHRDQQSTLFHALETGAIGSQDFYATLQTFVPATTAVELEDAWCALIGDFPEERFEWLEKLSKDYKLYILSNTNLIHIVRFEAMIDAKFGWKKFRSLFSGIGYSHQLGARKPEAELYERFLSEYGIERAEAVFVDDTLANVDAANALGIRSFHLQSGMEVTEDFYRWLRR